MDGQPLANVAVAFQPIGDSLTPGAGSSGRTNEKGQYTLNVIGGGKGAVVGWHRVEINPTVEGPDDDKRPAPKLRIPPKYNLRSELKFEVKAGTNNVADFPLNSK
jgi:hypothetical protein